MADANDCEFCDGYGFVWNNADPTSGQFHICEVCQPGQFEAEQLRSGTAATILPVAADNLNQGNRNG